MNKKYYADKVRNKFLAAAEAGKLLRRLVDQLKKEQKEEEMSKMQSTDDIYMVTFREYTNALRDTVWCEKEDTYLAIEHGECLVREQDLVHIKEYGGGLNTSTFKGVLYQRR